MMDDIIGKIKGFLLSPVESFQKAKGDTFQDAFIYYLILLVVYAVLSTIVAAVMPQPAIPGFPGGMPFGSGVFLIGAFIASIIGGIIGLFILGVILHIFVYLFGGRRGITETLKAVAYGYTPSLILGWIPIVNFLAALYTLVLFVFGIRELQEMSTTRAILAVLAPILILIAIAIVAAILFAAFIITAVSSQIA